VVSLGGERNRPWDLSDTWYLLRVRKARPPYRACLEAEGMRGAAMMESSQTDHKATSDSGGKG